MLPRYTGVLHTESCAHHVTFCIGLCKRRGQILKSQISDSTYKSFAPTSRLPVLDPGPQLAKSLPHGTPEWVSRWKYGSKGSAKIWLWGFGKAEASCNKQLHNPLEG